MFASQTAAIPVADIKGVSDETGTYSYDINKEYLEGRGGNLGFNTSSDYQFIRWMVWDAKANNGKGEEITNGTYITVKEPKNANTAFELVKAPANTVELWIKPLCVKRPKVVSSTPTYDSNGVYRDRRIIVMFNKQMSESSIYYTNDEVSKLKQEGKKLLETSENSGIYYGYWDGSDYNTYVFKNITITKRNDADVNLLKYYEAPYFDEKDKSVLRIDTKRGNEAPLGATDILVTINSPMACEIDSNLISLSGNYEWAYYTNGKIDTDAPYFTDSGDNKFTAHFDIDDQKNADETAKSIETERTVFDKPENYKNNYLRSKTLWIKGAFEDGGSGPNYLKWELYKVKSDYYPMEAEEKLIGNGQIDELRVAPTIAIIERKLDDGSTSDETFVTLPLTDEDEGLFRIDFICADKNARTSDPASFYFVYDKVGQSRFKKELISNSRPNEREETVSWRNPDDFDYDSVIVECWNGNRKIGESVYPDSNVLSHKFTNLENQKKYDYRFYTKDIYGNTSKNYYTYNDTTAPSVLTGVYTGVRNGIVDVYLNTPNNEDFDHIEYAESTSPNNFSDLDFSKNSTPNIHNLGRSVHKKKTFKNASAGKQYGYWLRTVDYSGNASNAILVQEVGGVTAGDICYWTKQDGLFCSEHYYSDKEVVGIVALTEANDSITKILTPNYDQYKFLVYTTGYKESYPQGKNGAGSLPTTNEDGYPTYKAIIKNSDALAQAPIFGYLKDTYNKNEKVTWYLPAINELLLIKYGTISASYSTNKCAVDDTYAFLNTKGKSNISSFSNPEHTDGEIVTSSVYFDHGNLTNFTIYFRNWYNKVWESFPRASHQDLKTRSLYMARVDMSDTDNPKKWDATEQ